MNVHAIALNSSAEQQGTPPRIDRTTGLAFERTRVAYDRTMMAWIRTATSLISFGFTIYKFFQIELGPKAQAGQWIGPREFALLMVAAGLLCMVLGTVEHRQNMADLQSQCPDLAHSRTGFVSLVVSTAGVLAFVVMILRR